jgi:IMP dehydrogenase
MDIREAYTFDDVLLVPAASSVLPGQAQTRTRLTRTIELGIPLVSAAMDTVTESSLAIVMAQSGGIGVIHKNLSIEAQANEVRKVKKFEAGMVVNPVTIGPEETLADALRLMADHKISGFPVVEPGTKRLVGILTNRDVRFAKDPNQRVAELMTKDNLVTVTRGRDPRRGPAPPAREPAREAAGRRRAATAASASSPSRTWRRPPATRIRRQGREGPPARRGRDRRATTA